MWTALGRLASLMTVFAVERKDVRRTPQRAPVATVTSIEVE
jgi:hypothetical protein